MVLVIAEIGINHNGDMNLAHEMIRQAAINGADVAKFQAYSVERLFGPNGEDPNERIYNGVKPLEFNKDQFAQIKQWCDEQDIEFMCSVFDEERLQWIEDVGVNRHKIASRTSKLSVDLAHKIAQTGKTCYMSLGFGADRLATNIDRSNEELALGVCETEPYPNVHNLYCVSEYPTEYANINLPQTFDGSIGGYYGFSDHSLGIGASLAAVARGAKVIEKHFTLSKSAVGFDHICSINPDELSDLVKYSREIERTI